MREKRWIAASCALFLLIAFREWGWWATSDPEADLLSDLATNRQLQLALGAATAWSCALALSTRTVTLSAYATLFAMLLHVAILGDFGLVRWLEEGQYDRLGGHLLPLVAAVLIAGAVAERWRRVWFARPLYVAAAVVWICALELVALDGRLFAHLGLGKQCVQRDAELRPLLLERLFADQGERRSVAPRRRAARAQQRVPAPRQRLCPSPTRETHP